MLGFLGSSAKRTIVLFQCVSRQIHGVMNSSLTRGSSTYPLLLETRSSQRSSEEGKLCLTSKSHSTQVFPKLSKGSISGQCSFGISFSLRLITFLTKLFLSMKSPAIILMHFFSAPGRCCFIQRFSNGRARRVISFIEQCRCARMYAKSPVRLIPATKNPPA